MRHSTSRLTLTIFILAAISVVARLSLELLDAQQTSASPPPPQGLTARENQAAGTITVFRAGRRTPILTEHAAADARPYIHPIVAPNGTVVTGPEGLFWAFTNLNGRDYFHHPRAGYWRRVSMGVTQSAGDEVRWQTTYELLDESATAVLVETARWSLRESNNAYLLSLDWRGQARVDVAIGATPDASAPPTASEDDNNGLFLSLPWRDGTRGEVVNAARQRNDRAAGQRAMWIDASIASAPRSPAHIAVFDYPDNSGYPQAWRIDRQSGIGAARPTTTSWTIKKGDT
jgi:methane monooxygenase PmoA-like